MISFRTLAAAAACALFLSACSAAIAPPYGDDRPMPTKSQSSRSIKPKGAKSPKKTTLPKKTKSTSSATWEGSCEPQGMCDRVNRTCEVEGTLCVFVDAGPIGSCLTIEQRKNCVSGDAAE